MMLLSRVLFLGSLGVVRVDFEPVRTHNAIRERIIEVSKVVVCVVRRPITLGRGQVLLEAVNDIRLRRLDVSEVSAAMITTGRAYVRYKEPTKCNKAAFLLRSIEGQIAVVTSRTDQWSRGPNIS